MHRKLSQKVLALFALAAFPVWAHEMLPTYPQLGPSYVDDVLKVQMRMFNKRQDVEYYEISVFDKDWRVVPFVTGYRILKVEYLSHVSFDIYIRKQDANKAMYVCSRSKLRKDKSQGTVVSSRICSKFKEPLL